MEVFLEELKRFINTYLEPETIKEMEYKSGEEIEDYLTGEDYIIIKLENGKEKRINVTNQLINQDYTKITRDILFELS